MPGALGRGRTSSLPLTSIRGISCFEKNEIGRKRKSGSRGVRLNQVGSETSVPAVEEWAQRLLAHGRRERAGAECSRVGRSSANKEV
ncbi:hypothetical protein chiPu_0009182 [Chiloscyllium punctatum]|uniref:Uncharacterized protein n=1 Tax=Chiloscyllium punctatum TaxID=137246 RepID=A0A401SK13_CHIPU|nr:hypothetical protein [Chiloscyllium punctatum]